MTLQEKCAKLLEYSVILKAADKKNWQAFLPKMSDSQVQTLYGVLTDEVKAWKKEGISIVPDVAIEITLMPEEPKGASVSSLLSRLEGKVPPAQLPKAELAKKPEPATAFAKELEREMSTPELTEEKKLPASEPEPELPEAEEEIGEIKPKLPNADRKAAWMLSDEVVVPKTNLGVIRPQPLGVPKVRNRVAKHGLRELKDIRGVDDLSKIEGAHLRQGPLNEQIAFIKQRIAQLARENDMLPVNILPVFEQSPLFQSYVKAGSLLIEKNIGEDNKIALDQIMGELEAMGQDPLSQEEFEAVADLKKDLETMAGM